MYLTKHGIIKALFFKTCRTFYGLQAKELRLLDNYILVRPSVN